MAHIYNSTVALAIRPSWLLRISQRLAKLSTIDRPWPAVLVVFCHRTREMPAQVARRAGLASGAVIRGMETGDQPACTLPVPAIEAVGNDMRACGEEVLADLFEAGAGCEAALTGFSSGNCTLQPGA